MRFLLLFLFLISTLWSQPAKAIKCGFHEQHLSVNKVASISGRDVPDLDEYYISPGGYFRIHFTRIGTHAVTGTETGSVPDYVLEAGIAADSAYHLITGDLGFLPPLPDNNIDGPELDIYIKNWGGSYYGMTYFGSSAPSSTYLVVDNDYVESSYATSGLAALRVTIAHEFFHMVQLRYAHPFTPYSTNPYWYEISSVWMEEKCYPDIDDYHSYVADNFNQTNFPNINDGSFGFAFSYGHGLFGQVLDSEYGSQSGKHIMLDIWESLGDQEATDNLDKVLSASPWNSSLLDALGKYSVYNVFTGSRAIAGSYYEDANLLPEVNTTDYLLPITFPMPYDFELESLQTGFKKFSIQTLSDLYIRGENISENQRVYLTVHTFDEGSSLKSSLGDPWISCYSASSQDYLIFPMVNGAQSSSATVGITFQGDTFKLKNTIQSLWPNPSFLKDSPIHLNVMLASAGMIKIFVYNILGQMVYEQNQFSPEGIRIIDLSLPESIPSGIYFVQIIAGESSIGRKFTVLK